MERDMDFEIAFYEQLDARNPADERVMELLAHLYTKVGRIQEGLAMDRRLRDCRPGDPLVHYNLACSLSLTGHPDEAVAMLQKALDLGYRDLSWILQDKDLEPLKGYGPFEELLARLAASGAGEAPA